MPPSAAASGTVIRAAKSWAAIDRGGVCDAQTRAIRLADKGKVQAIAGFAFSPDRRRWGEFHARLSRQPRPGSSVMLTVGTRQFLLVSRGGWAWSRGPLQEQAIIDAARGAGGMRIEGRDASGRRFADRYLLAGAPTAIDAVAPRADGRAELVGLPRDRIRAELEAAGLEPRQAKLRAKQIWHWIYNRGVSDFAAMSDIAKAQRGWFAERFVITRPEVIEAQVSSDGTRKWLLKTHDGHDFEMVFIPDADRGTLCVSSQVGCTLNCRFCHTGTMKLVRNLEPGEIVGQVMLARDALGEWPKEGEAQSASSYTSEGRML